MSDDKLKKKFEKIYEEMEERMVKEMQDDLLHSKEHIVLEDEKAYQSVSEQYPFGACSEYFKEGAKASRTRLLDKIIRIVTRMAWENKRKAPKKSGQPIESARYGAVAFELNMLKQKLKALRDGEKK